jgi:hypothetical protein
METEDPSLDERSPQPDNLYVLRHPVDFGKERITELEMKPTGRHMRDFKMKMGMGDEELTILVEFYTLCQLGLTLAGKPRVIADSMHPADIVGVGMLVLGFIMPGQKIGIGASL